MMKQQSTLIHKSPRKVPLAMQANFKDELDNMEKQGIILKFDGRQLNSPERLKSFVIVKKPSGPLCICLDPTDLKRYLVHPEYKTIDEIIDQLRNVLFHWMNHHDC